MSSFLGFDNSVLCAENVNFDPGAPPNAGQVTTNGQLLIGATVAPNIRVGNLTSTGGSVTITNGAGTINLEAGTTTPLMFTADTGSAIPAANNLSILGGPGVTTSGVGSTITINSVVFTDTGATTLAVDNGYNATAAGTYNMPATAAQGEMIIVFCDTAGAVVLDCPALNFIRIGSLITSSGGTATSTSIGDSLTLRYRLSSLTWESVGVVGTWLVA